MTLNLAVKMTLDKTGFVPGAKDASNAVHQIGTEAEVATSRLIDMGEAVQTATSSASRGASATITAATAQAAASAAATKAMTEHAGAIKITAAQAQNLSYQLDDVFTSLMGGISPMQTLVQQGPQITQSFGGIGNTLRVATSYITPFRLGLAAVAGVAIAGVKSVVDYSSSMRDASIAAQGLGRNIGTSASQIDHIAQASAGGARVSIAAARAMATEFTNTGQIGVENFGELINIVRDFGTTTSKDAPAAAKALAELMADPAKGAETLSRSYGLVDAGTERLVKRLADQGNKTEAVSTLTKALAQNLVDTGKTVSWYAQMWDLVARAASNAGDAIGRAVSPKTGADLRADLEKRLEELRKQGPAIPGLQGRGTTSSSNGIWNDLGPRASGSADERQAEINRLQAEIDRLKKEEEAAAARRQAAIVDAARTRALDIAGASGAPAVLDAQRRQQLADEQRKLAEAGSGPRQLSATDVQAEKDRLKASEDQRIAAALDAKTRALSTWISESQRAQQLADVDVAIAQTRDPIERAELERKRVLIQLSGQEIGTSEAAAAANLAYARSLADVSAQAKGSLTDVLADASARERANALVLAGVLPIADLNRELQIEAATRQLVVMAAKAEGAEKERLLQLITATRAAITAQTEAQKQAAGLQDVANGKDRLETLRTQIALVGQSEAAQTRALALLEAEQKIRAQGYSGSVAEQIRSQARATADLTTALERQKSAWSEIQQTGGDAIDTLIEGMRTGKDVSQQLIDDLSKEALKLALANPLKNAIFGQNLPTLADAGGLLGGLFGGKDASTSAMLPSAVATATISAGTVIVNGTGLGGIGSVGGSMGGLGQVGAGVFGSIDRSAFAGELADPAVRNRLFAMTEAEVGGQGPAAQQAFMETLFNRGSARGMSLSQVMSDRAYFPESTFTNADRVMGSNLDAKYAGMFGQVRGGSNISGWATGNASGTVGFGGGPQTFAAGGERFGIEGMDQGWAKLQQSSSSAASSLGSLGTTSNQTITSLGQFSAGTNQAANALSTSSGGIAQASQQMGSTMTTTATTTQSAFGQLTSTLGNAFSSLFSGLGSMLGGIGGGIGKIFGFAEGGAISGPGTGTSDSILMWGSNGEFMVNAAATAKHRPLLEAINSGRDVTIGRFAGGGYVGVMPMMGGAANGNEPARFAQAAPAAPAPVLQQTIQNNSRAEVSTREESDGKGGRRQVVVIEEAVGAALTRPRSAAQTALKTAFSLQPKVTRR